MILFFYGEDTYRLNQKIKQLKEKFISASLGDTNLVIVDGETATFQEINRQITALPFLSKSRLVIVNNLFSAKEGTLEKIIEFLPKVPETTVLLIAEEGNPDRRTSLYKKLNKPGISQEFKLLEPDQLRRWIVRECETKNVKCEAAAVIKLIEYVGPDLWRMSAEIAKLANYDKNITSENIELMVQPQIQANIFELMDAVASKNQKKAVKELYKLYGEGAAVQYILSMIVMEFRNLLIVKDLGEKEGNINPWVMAKKAGLHPFVAKKSLELCKRYELTTLKKNYRLLAVYDTNIKTGKIEPKVALELLILRLTRNPEG